MAHKAASNRIRGQEHPLVELGRQVGMHRVSRSHIPAYCMGIVRQPVLVRLIFPIVSDEGHSSIARAEGIIDDRLEDTAVDLCVDFDVILASSGKHGSLSDCQDRGSVVREKGWSEIGRREGTCAWRLRCCS